MQLQQIINKNFVNLYSKNNYIMAKKQKESGVATTNKFQEALDRLNKTYGVGSILELDSKRSDNYDIISTGSIGFDHITLGVGGFVKGKMYELRGGRALVSLLYVDML